MSSMDPNMPMPPLDPNEFDLSNGTQAKDFLSQLLDDSVLQYDARNFSRRFWYGIIVFIGICAVHNLLWKCSLILRKRAATAKTLKSATSAAVLGRIVVIITNTCRRVTYPQFTPRRAQFWMRVPPLGTMLLLFVYIGFLLALQFINNDVGGAQYWTSLGIRAGWLAIAQMPLLTLLAGKYNFIGIVTGLSYERLNILHRWVSRSLLLMAVMHVGYQNYAWNKYGVRSLEWSTDLCVPTGFAAFALLLWLNISTLAPIRNIAYELFVIQHLLTFFGFIVAIMYHLPSTALETRIYIWIPIGLYLFDRLVRTARSAWNNSSQSRATVVSFGSDATKIHVRSSRVRKWAPGNFVLLSIPRYGIVQSHPSTIVSTPLSHKGDLVFLLRAHKGFTKNLLSTPNISSMGSKSDTKNEEYQPPQENCRAFIDGPYGGTQGDFAAFDTVLLIAGSTGITFTLSILLDLAGRLGSQELPVRRLEFVWAVKRQIQMTWVSDELKLAFSRLQAAGIETMFRAFVTCNDQAGDAVSCSRRVGCACDTSNDQSCCCANREHIAEPSDSTLARGNEMSLLWASIEPCRPNIDMIFSDLLLQTHGEIGVAVCGPLGLSTAVRKAATKSMKVKQGIYLHVEGFSW